MRLIPFFNETFLPFKFIRGTVKLFNMRKTIATSIENMDQTLEEEAGVWENIANTSVNINQTPQLILLICKCIADEEFRRWSLGNQVMFAWIGSLIPSITARSNVEDISGNAEDQKGF